MTDTQYWMLLATAQTMLLSDSNKPGRHGAIYIPGLSLGMIKSCNLLGWLSKQSRRSTLPIAFNGSDGEQFGFNEGDDQDRPQPKERSKGKGWPGRDHYIEELGKLGVPSTRLLPTGPGYHTRHEMAQLVTTADRHGWKRVGIVTVPWHYVTVFTMLVSAMKKADYFFAAYAMPAPNTDWYQSILGSQGLTHTVPVTEMSMYFPKLKSYQANGRACSFEELFYYLRHREKIAQMDAW